VDGPTFETMTRRSTRVRARIPIRITSLDPAPPVCLSCETLMVNAHGCAARFSQALEVGTPVRLEVPGTVATARVVLCQALGEKSSEWLVGFELDTPGNIWGLKPCPGDWARFETDAPPPTATAGQRATIRTPSQLKMQVWPLASPSTRTLLSAKAGDEELKKQLAAQQEAIAKLQDQLAGSLASAPELVRKQISDAEEQVLAQVRERLSVAIAETVRPLREELTICRKKAEDAQQIRAALAEQLEQLPWHIQQHTQAALQPLQEQARAELQRIITQARSQDESETARGQALQASAQALQKELAQARALLESSMGSLPERIHEPITTAVEDALAQARAEISKQLASELEAVHQRAKGEPEDHRAYSGEIDAKREDLQRWLAEQQTLCVQNASRHLEQLTNDLALRAASKLEEKLKADVEAQAKHIEADLHQRLEPLLDQANGLRREVLSLLSTLQQESQRGEVRVGALLKEKDGVEVWMAERVADVQRIAGIETSAHILPAMKQAVLALHVEARSVVRAAVLARGAQVEQ